MGRRDVHSQVGASAAGVLVAVLVLAGILGVVGWVGWRTFGVEPQRSVAAAGHAYTSHDWAAFEPYVDVEAVVDAGIADILPKELQGGGVLGELGKAAIEAQKPKLVSQAREGLRSAVESRPANESWLREQRGYLAPLRTQVLQRGPAEARVRVSTGTRWGDVEARMVPREGRWVVVEVLNLPEVLGRAGVTR